MSSGYPTGSDRAGRLHAAVQPCRDCREPIVWATNQNGKRIPLDPEDLGVGYVAPRVHLLVEGGGDWRFTTELRDRELAEEALSVRGLRLRLRTCHYDTCAQRQPRERADLA